MQLFNVAFLSGLLLAPVALAAPGKWAHVKRRGVVQLSRPNNQVEFDDASSPPSALYSTNWAGAVWTEENDTFNYITGTFTVPTPSGANGAGGAFWVGIDGSSCQTAILQTGISFTIQGGEPIFNAWFEWYPAPAYFFTNFNVSPGDDIKLSVTAQNKTSGTIVIENLTTLETETFDASSSTPLCGQNAEWIVEDYQEDGYLIPFANFTSVTFSDAKATGPTPTSEPYGLVNATPIVLINTNNQTVTKVNDTGSLLTITYV